MKLILGTRGSALATTQAGQFADRMRERHPGLEIETVIIKTSGDRFSAEINAGERKELPTSADAPNVKAMFVKEIESALLEGKIDFAVHSSKDLPAEVPEGLAIAAYPKREDPRDAMIGATLESLPKDAKVGTASLRRQLQLKEKRPDLQFVAIRGNVDTRLRKLEEGEADAILLAEAGLRRLGLDSVKRTVIGADIVVPAPGQGALAIETRVEGEARDLVAALDDETTRCEVEFERAVLTAVGGGCSTPLGVIARADEEKVRIWSFWSDIEGKNSVREQDESPRDKESLDALLKRTVSRLTSAQT